MQPTASWVIREKETGKVLWETFSRRVVAALNTTKYEAVPIGEYLGEVNRRIRQQKFWDREFKLWSQLEE